MQQAGGGLEARRRQNAKHQTTGGECQQGTHNIDTISALAATFYLPSCLQKMQLMTPVSYSGIHHDRCKVRHALEPPFRKFSALPGAADYKRQEKGSIVCFHFIFTSY